MDDVDVFTYLAGGNTALSLVLTVAANLATIISIPIWAGIALNRWEEAVSEGVDVTVSFLDVAGILVALVRDTHEPGDGRPGEEARPGRAHG